MNHSMQPLPPPRGGVGLHGHLRGQEVFNWLSRLELGHHFDSFLSAGYEDLSICRRIGEGDLAAIGVTDIHERLALLQAIRLLHVTPRKVLGVGAGVHFPREEIELQLLSNKSSRVLFYNNNHLNNGTYKFEENGDADYSECAEFDLTRCYCEGGGGVCSGQCGGGGGGSDPEPFYESVLLPNSHPHPRGSGLRSHLLQHQQGSGVGKEGGAGQKSFKRQLRDQVILDGINFSRIPDEMALRAVAAKYALEFSSAAGVGGPGSIPYNGGGASFSSTSTASSSSSGYPSSLASNRDGHKLPNSSTSSANSSASSSSSAGQAAATPTSVSISNSVPPTPTWLREGLPLLEFQQQVLQQLREIWLEERRKLSRAKGLGSGGRLLTTETGNSIEAGSGSGVNPSCLEFGLSMGSRSTQNLLGEGGPSPGGRKLHNNHKNGWDTPTKRSGKHSANYGEGVTRQMQIYTPGVYQPSSCLRDQVRDDIYDYIPPRPKPQTQVENEEDEEQLLHNSNSSPQCSTRLRGATLSRLGRGGRNGNSSSGGRDYGFVLSPRKGGGGSAAKFSTLRGRSASASGVNNPPQNSLSSYTISGSCSSSNTASSTSGSNNPQYGFVSGFPHYSYTHGPPGDETVGCRTLVNLHKLGRRLGLTRFFRTLRIQNPDGSGTETTRRHYFPQGSSNSSTSSDRVLYGITPTSAETLARLRRLQSQTNYNPGFQDDPSPSGSGGDQHGIISDSLIANMDGQSPARGRGPLASLPSNERIIETINRLKYEELQRRKERISAEHQMMLKELKNSGPHSTSTGPPTSSSTFYVDSGVGGPPSSSDYFEESSIPSSAGGDHEDPDHQENYEEPFDSVPSNVTNNPHENVAGTRTSRTSNESFSEIFARHLKSRMSNGSQSQNQPALGATTTNCKNDPAEELRRRGSTQGPGSAANRSSGSSTSSGEVAGGGSGSPGSRNSFLGRIGSNKDGCGSGWGRRRSSKHSTKEGAGGNRDSCGSGGQQEELDDPVHLGGGSFSLGGLSLNGCDHNPIGGSSEEEFTSLGSSGQLSSSYDGPFDGVAVALVDSQPSPYDRHALRYKKGDVIQIISKKATGLWIGKVGEQIGHFKFINVRLLPETGGEISLLGYHQDLELISRSHPLSPHHHSHPLYHAHHHSPDLGPEERQNMADVISGEGDEGEEMDGDNKSGGGGENSPTFPRTPRSRGKVPRKGRPKSVGDLLHRIGLDEHISLFILHGFETLDLFKELEEEDLDRLGILNENHRGKILTAVQLLREYDTDSGTSLTLSASVAPAIQEGSAGGTLNNYLDEEVPGVDRPPAQTLYQFQYYKQHTPAKSGSGSGSGNSNNNSCGQSPNDIEDTDGDCVTTAVEVHQPHFPSTHPMYRFNNQPRDSGIFLKESFHELGATGEGPPHPDGDSDEIILSPINLQQSGGSNNASSASNNRYGPSPQLNRKNNTASPQVQSANMKPLPTPGPGGAEGGRNRFLQAKSLFESNGFPRMMLNKGGKSSNNHHNYDNIENGVSTGQGELQVQNGGGGGSRFLYCEKSSDSGISTNSPPPVIRNEYRS